jgi:glycosyltransferase involved in cell wall biosynthesis
MGNIPTAFMVSLISLMMTHPDVEWNLIIKEGSLLSQNREHAVMDALNTGSDYVLFLDDDMYFTPAVLERLLSWDVPIVGANYPYRELPLKWTAQIPTVEKSSGLEEVKHMGFGVCLINSVVFRNIPQPWFEQKYNPETKRYIGEDVGFFRKCAEYGYLIFVDHDASKDVGHIGNYTYSYASNSRNPVGL